MDRSPPAPPVVSRVATLDPRRVERLRRIGWLLDNSLRIPGTKIRVGLDPVIGLVPGLGDLVGGGLSLYIVLEAARLGLPREVLARMGWNVVVDTLVGEVPFLGDLFDAGFKSNARNLALIDGYVRHPSEERRASRRFVALLVGGLVLLVAGTAALTVLLVHFLSGLVR